MIGDDLSREGLGLLGTAAVMLIEDAHPLLATPPGTADAAHALAAALQALGSDLSALGAAAAVVTRRAAGPPCSGSTEA